MSQIVSPHDAVPRTLPEIVTAQARAIAFHQTQILEMQDRINFLLTVVNALVEMADPAAVDAVIIKVRERAAAREEILTSAGAGDPQAA